MAPNRRSAVKYAHPSFVRFGHLVRSEIEAMPRQSIKINRFALGGIYIAINTPNYMDKKKYEGRYRIMDIDILQNNKHTRPVLVLPPFHHIFEF